MLYQTSRSQKGGGRQGLQEVGSWSTSAAFMLSLWQPLIMSSAAQYRSQMGGAHNLMSFYPHESRTQPYLKSSSGKDFPWGQFDHLFLTETMRVPSRRPANTHNSTGVTGSGWISVKTKTKRESVCRTWFGRTPVFWIRTMKTNEEKAGSLPAAAFKPLQFSSKNIKTKLCSWSII